MDYAELQVTSNYSFLRGASHPEELVLQAATLGHTAIAITDRNTLAGVVRAHVASKLHGIQLIIGARLDLRDASSLICLPTNRAAYGRLSQLLTLGKRRTNKGACHLFLEDILSGELFKGGKNPEKSCHCVIDKPESVNLVKPPTKIIIEIIQNIKTNQ